MTSAITASNPIAAELDVDEMVAGLLSEDEYIEAMRALGLSAVIDVGQAR